jgi:hypothetical protein
MKRAAAARTRPAFSLPTDPLTHLLNCGKTQSTHHGYTAGILALGRRVVVVSENLPMDGSHFDGLIKTLTAPGSRRRALGGLLAGALGFLGARVEEMSAKKGKLYGRRGTRAAIAVLPAAGGSPLVRQCQYLRAGLPERQGL